MITDIVSLYGQTASVCATLASLGPTVTQVRYFEIVSELSSVFLLPYQFIETYSLWQTLQGAHNARDVSKRSFIFLRFGPPSTLIRHENGSFRKRWSNRRNWKLVLQFLNSSFEGVHCRLLSKLTHLKTTFCVLFSLANGLKFQWNLRCTMILLTCVVFVQTYSVGRQRRTVFRAVSCGTPWQLSLFEIQTFVALFSFTFSSILMRVSFVFYRKITQKVEITCMFSK